MIKTIVMNAPPNSGKDFLGEKLAEFLEGNVLRFKDDLYRETADWIGMDVDRFIDFATCRSTKEEHLLINPDDRGGDNISPREALIHVSENIIKPQKGKTYFGEQLAKRLTDGWNIITDGGFEEEFVPVAEASDQVSVVRMTADGCTFEGDSRGYLNQEFLKQFHNVYILTYHNSKSGQRANTFDIIKSLPRDFLDY